MHNDCVRIIVFSSESINFQELAMNVPELTTDDKSEEHETVRLNDYN